jgi:hypothetical protein
MNTIIKFIIAAACAASLMYFDSLDNTPKEKTNVGNSHVGSRDGNFRVRIGNLRLHRVCVVPTKQASRRVVKCPVCETWTRTPDNRYMCKKIERIIIATQIKKRKKHELARTHHQVR